MDGPTSIWIVLLLMDSPTDKSCGLRTPDPGPFFDGLDLVGMSEGLFAMIK